MIIKEIARSFSKTLQEKDYEPVNVFASYKAELSETDNPEEVSKELYEKAVNDVGLAISEKMWEKFTNPQKVVRENVKKNMAKREEDITLDDVPF